MGMSAVPLVLETVHEGRELGQGGVIVWEHVAGWGNMGECVDMVDQVRCEITYWFLRSEVGDGSSFRALD